LEKLAADAGKLAETAHHSAVGASQLFGLFGTSIAATFLTGGLGAAVDFFVDEDPNRQGKTWCKRPIYAPSQVPSGSHVMIGLAPVVAERILARMKALGLSVHFYAPPPL
jgi:hypothetical protein